MTTANDSLISFIIPLYNESKGLKVFHDSLLKTIDNNVGDSYEIIYCDDGSSDNTDEIIREWCKNNSRIKLIRLSRNFGKESALSAGIMEARGTAIITLDGDSQHPLELIPKFIEYWKNGVKVVIGVRENKSGGGLFKHLGSKVFYKLFNLSTGQKLIVGSSDYRLIDRSVQQEFIKLPESDRITRGLIDWLGFKRELIYFKANSREHGDPSYSHRKLIRLATDSFTSMTPTPLYLFGYLGVFITAAAFILGLSVFIEQPLLGDPLHWKFTGTAMLGILILFLVGIVLMSQGILSLYVSSIHSQSKRRPLYIIDYGESVGIIKKNDT